MPIEITNWNEGYETSDTRKTTSRLVWVRQNILATDKHWVRLWTKRKDAAQVWAGWTALVWAASQEDVRGTVSSVEDVSLLMRVPEEYIRLAIVWGVEIGWIKCEISEFDASGNHPEGVGILSGDFPETFRKPSGDCRDTIRMESGNYPETVGMTSGDCRDNIRRPSGNLPETIGTTLQTDITLQDSTYKGVDAEILTQEEGITSLVSDKKEEPHARAPRKVFVPPTEQEWTAYCRETWPEWTGCADSWSYYQSVGWMAGKAKISDWKAAARTSHTRTASWGSGNRRQSYPQEFPRDSYGPPGERPF